MKDYDMIAVYMAKSLILCALLLGLTSLGIELYEGTLPL